ncbi:MAG TPA: polysaccharide deacetylase family protein [Verrucomicrobiae bacterium]|nr:polysaccharide deacetylase family protein [Verrucomicrobiae bacterium]
MELATATGEASPAPPLRDPREVGRAEVRLCRELPSQRAESRLGDLTAGPGWLVPLRLAAVRHPKFAAILLSIYGSIGSVLGKLPVVRRRAKRSREARDSFAYFSGAIEEAGGWDGFRREFAVRLPVLCYHHVGEKLPQSWPLLTVSSRVFRRQMEWLRNEGYAPIHAADWLAWMKQGTPLPEKPVLITFDDGYSDLMENALPVLRELGFKATIFIVSQHIGAASTWDVPLGHPSRPLMSAEQIRNCPAHGVEIGGHSRTHPDLRTLSELELKTELEGCRVELSGLMGQPVNTFAYCFGFQNENVRRSAREGYELAFSAKPGLNAWRTDRHCLRRMFVHPSRINFALQVKYGIDAHAVYRFMQDRGRKLLRAWVAPGGPKPMGDRIPASTGAVSEGNR